MSAKNITSTLKKNTMLIVLVVVYIFFVITTQGSIFKPMNFNALITQNAYVYILACGMLMCMLTGGNIDLSCGSFVCLLGAIGGASAYGGTGKISGVIIGATLMGLINQGMSIMGIDANYQSVVKGIVLLVAVMFDVLSKRQKR